jgi:hypothetical protein
LKVVRNWNLWPIQGLQVAAHQPNLCFVKWKTHNRLTLDQHSARDYYKAAQRLLFHEMKDGHQVLALRPGQTFLDAHCISFLRAARNQKVSERHRRHGKPDWPHVK